ncbi:hypothetical protein [Phytohabitans kaempferiae]|uniref:Uncharacterized protein n=1 Tax=Phytohabitans kaempferiae TaxID=1620943 RepID=A0ABV6M2C0_9ACTN
MAAVSAAIGGAWVAAVGVVVFAALPAWWAGATASTGATSGAGVCGGAPAPVTVVGPVAAVAGVAFLPLVALVVLAPSVVLTPCAPLASFFTPTAFAVAPFPGAAFPVADLAGAALAGTPFADVAFADAAFADAAFADAAFAGAAFATAAFAGSAFADLVFAGAAFAGAAFAGAAFAGALAPAAFFAAFLLVEVPARTGPGDALRAPVAAFFAALPDPLRAGPEAALALVADTLAVRCAAARVPPVRVPAPPFDAALRAAFARSAIASPTCKTGARRDRRALRWLARIRNVKTSDNMPHRSYPIQRPLNPQTGQKTL